VPVSRCCCWAFLQAESARGMDCVFDVAKGVRGVNARADPANANVCASAAAQVECLVDLATDPNVLGRQWIGLSAWM
jgi:hypothetical protein